MPAPIPDARLSLTTSPVMSSDIIGAATLYYTDGYTVLYEAGPWTSSSQRDAFVISSANTLYTNPWSSRTNNM